MKGHFNGPVNMNMELDATPLLDRPALIVNGRFISLQAIAAVSPTMLAVLEELAKPEADGGVYRVERTVVDGEPKIGLVKVGLAGHAAQKASDFARRRIRA